METKVAEQLSRVNRWFERFAEINHSRLDVRDSDYRNDVVYAFFINCWAMKDWISRTKAVPKADVDDFFHKDADMFLCQSIANGSKHLNPSIEIDARQFTMPLGGNPYTEWTFWIRVNGSRVEAFALAGWCMGKVEGFCKKHGLV